MGKYLISLIAVVAILGLYQNCDPSWQAIQNSAEKECIPSGNNNCENHSPDLKCSPGAQISCYEGPTGTKDVGLCKSGQQTCNSSGSGYGPCVGQTLPQTETCDSLDHDCDGASQNGLRCDLCYQYTGIFFDDAANDCRSMPANDRSHYAGMIDWKGNEFLYHSTGNDIELFDISTPFSPLSYHNSSWHGQIGNQGDNDYGLEALLMCDDCRYAVAKYRLANMYFDLGNGSRPEIVNYKKAEQPYQTPVYMSFKHDGMQFLVTIGFNRACSGVSSVGTALYVFDSYKPSELQHLQCLTTPPDLDWNLRIDAGRYLRHPALNNNQPHLWTIASSQVSVWKVKGTGLNTRLEFVREIDKMWAFGRGNAWHGFDIDLNAKVAVSVNRYGLKTWQLSDLEDPRHVGTYDGDELRGTIVTLRYPHVFTSGGGIRLIDQGTYELTNRVFDISDMEEPIAVDPDYWKNTTHSWNQCACTSQLKGSGAVYSADGNYLYVSRHALGQTFRVVPCQ
jgi:hypothetical protein